MKSLCGGEDIVNYNVFLGAGSHGYIFGSHISKSIAVKIYKIEYCDDVKKGEFAFQEIARNHIIKYSFLIDGNVDIPKVYGFKYLPDTGNPKCCMYFMDRVFDLIQLSFNYDRLYDSTLSSGRYVGIDTLKLLGYNNNDISVMNISIASMMAVLHYGMKMDAYDVEFVLSRYDNKIYAIDYDKVSYYNEQYPYTVKRKLSENDYDHCYIGNQLHLARFLAKSIMYAPSFYYEEYQEWKETYINVAKYFDKQQLATNVMTQYERYF